MINKGTGGYVLIYSLLLAGFATLRHVIDGADALPYKPSFFLPLMFVFFLPLALIFLVYLYKVNSGRAKMMIPSSGMIILLVVETIVFISLTGYVYSSLIVRQQYQDRQVSFDILQSSLSHLTEIVDTVFMLFFALAAVVIAVFDFTFIKRNNSHKNFSSFWGILAISIFCNGFVVVGYYLIQFALAIFFLLAFWGK